MEAEEVGVAPAVVEVDSGATVPVSISILPEVAPVETTVVLRISGTLVRPVLHSDHPILRQSRTIHM